MADAHKNFAYSTVATAPSPASSGTSLVVASGDGAKFPAASFNATVWPANAQPTTANAEIVRVTVKSTDTFTITRTQESSSARTIVVGDQIAATITAKTLTDIETESLDVIAAANPTAADWSNNSHKITSVSNGTAAQDAAAFGQLSGLGYGVSVFGDGSDAAAVFDGVNTFAAFATLSGSTYTLIRDTFLSSATLDSGIQIRLNGFRLFCSGTFTGVDATSIIQWNGLAASVGVAGGALNNSNSSINVGTGASSPGTVGSAGGTAVGGNGTNAATVVNYGGTGGTGGTAGANSGGAGGVLIAATGLQSSLRAVPWALLARLQSSTGFTNPLAGGTGGGAGGGDGSSVSGAGGTGGGIVPVFAKAFAGTGAIQARGGAGGTPISGNRGGGGGGGGGVVLVVSQSVSGGAISGWTIDANGGARGLKIGTATENATAGSNGTVILLGN